MTELLTVIGLQTLLRSGFLRDHGWSPIRRTEVEWPSLLALAPGGWLVSASFALSGLAVALLANAIFRSATRARLTSTVALAAVAIGLFGVMFPTDGPGAASTWHGDIHDWAYNLIPIGSALSMASASGMPTPTRVRAVTPVRVAIPLLAALLISIALTTRDDIAQLARYGVLGSISLWLVVVAIAVAPQRQSMKFGNR